MDLRSTPEEESFRKEVKEWLADHLVGDFAALGGRGGPGDEDQGYEVRLEWERLLGRSGWTCVGWATEHGGRGATLTEQVIFAEEYARALAPARVGIIGEGLLGPTLIAFGTDEQRRRFLPPIVKGEELWCQGYSEPNAGSDLANVSTKAELDGDEWVVTGQKVWTSLAHWADWCFVVCRTEAGSKRHKGLSYLLVPMRQPGVEIRPIVQLTGTSEFSEVFFDGARTPAANVVGEVGEGWRVAMGTLAFERGVFTLAQQVGYEREWRRLCALARANGGVEEPVMRQRLAQSWTGVQLMRWNALRTMAGEEAGAPGPESSISKLHWGTWHRALGELAVDVVGAPSMITEPDGVLTEQQRVFLFSRADTIYGGSNQIQRNLIGERVLGLPRPPA